MGVADGAAPLIAEEVRRLAARYGDASAYLGGAATKEVLRRRGRTARLIHLAAHAEHRDDDPMLSGLRLGDCWLTIPDVYELQMSPEVLVLSGCGTGRTWVSEGDDVFGLLRGFLSAGATSIVSSLWRVSDEVTLRFMEAFHVALDERGSAAEAARAAALAVRREHPHPYHWAPFTVTGRGGPIAR
jgi:CHAT domain-containing protein